MASVDISYPPDGGDIAEIRDYLVKIVKEMQYLLQNLDEGNVVRANSVEAHKIDTTHAKIANAQIENIGADKITAGTIDTEEVTIKDGDGAVEIKGKTIALRDENGRIRMLMGINSLGKFVFALYDKNGKTALSMDSNGEACFSGNVDTEKNVLVGQNVKIRTSGEFRTGQLQFGEECKIEVIEQTSPAFSFSAKRSIPMYFSTQGNTEFFCNDFYVNGKSWANIVSRIEALERRV